MARAMWKGVLRLGELQVPVKLYSAVQDRDVRFTLLAPKSHTPVEQRMVKPDSGEVVPYPEVRKGFELEGSYVLLDKEELDQIAPKPSRDIEIERCVGTQALGPEWFVRPYYLGPDGDAERYAALARALFEQKREGIAHWVMRNAEYSGVLRSDGAVLTLITLRHEGELLDLDRLPQPEAREHSDREAKMAEQLIAEYEGEFDPDGFRNEHREKVLALIEAKAQGKRVRLTPVREKRAEPSLLNALEASLRAAKKESRAEDKPARPKSTRARRGHKEQHVA